MDLASKQNWILFIDENLEVKMMESEPTVHSVYDDEVLIANENFSQSHRQAFFIFWGTLHKLCPKVDISSF